MNNSIPITKEELMHFRKVAESIAINAGRILLDFRGKAQIVKSKSDALDIVTQADEASEKYILTELNKSFSRHSYLSEESGQDKRQSDYRWIIDPLDGTKEFFRGMTLFSVNLALEYKNELIIGVVYVPISEELFSAVYGLGASLSGKIISVSNVSELEKSLIVVHPPRSNLSEERFNQIWKTMGTIARKTYRFRALASDIFSLCWIAMGAYEAFYVPIKYPNWWDIAPGLLLVSEAGGKVTTAKGNPLTEKNYHKEGILVTNGKIHKQLLKLINS